VIEASVEAADGDALNKFTVIFLLRRFYSID